MPFGILLFVYQEKIKKFWFLKEKKENVTGSVTPACYHKHIKESLEKGGD